MKSLSIVFSLFISIIATAQIGAKVQQQGKIYGVWQNNQFGYQMTLILKADGSGEFDGEAITFTTQGKQLIITSGPTKTTYDHLLQGSSLTLSGGDLEKAITFSRTDAEGSSQPIAIKFSENKSEGVSPKTDTQLIGNWSGNGEMIAFKADGNCEYNGNVYPYEVSQGHIVMKTNQMIMAYTILKNQLTLTINGQQLVYTKALGSGSAGTAKSSSAITNSKTVPAELVGQWCYLNMNTNSQTSRCIVLNGDGTYTYSYEGSRSVSTNEISGGTSSQSSDRGTWYVQGDRIYYNSTSSGQGSYRLEKRNHPKNVNDPMIVLDGEPYVTITARPPWR